MCWFWPAGREGGKGDERRRRAWRTESEAARGGEPRLQECGTVALVMNLDGNSTRNKAGKQAHSRAGRRRKNVKWPAQQRPGRGTEPETRTDAVA